MQQRAVNTEGTANQSVENKRLWSTCPWAETYTKSHTLGTQGINNVEGAESLRARSVNNLRGS